MNNVESNFVPYQIAVDMKSIGFDEEVLRYYDDESKEFCDVMKIIKAPLYQQVFRFFREKYMLSGEIYIFKNIWNFDIEDISNSIQLYTSDIMCYNSYEEAEVECLVKLIEIAKEQNVK